MWIDLEVPIHGPGTSISQQYNLQLELKCETMVPERPKDSQKLEPVVQITIVYSREKICE